MAARDEEQVQMAIRIPKRLHRELRVHCVVAGRSLMDFVADAIKEKLTRERSRRPRAGNSAAGAS